MFEHEIYMSAVFVAGLISFFSPCILPVLPVYIGILTDGLVDINDREVKREENISQEDLLQKKKFRINFKLLINTIVFVGGLSTSFIILGFGAGALGQVISNKGFYVGIGIIVILLGIHQTGLIRISFLERQKKMEFARSKRTDVIGIFLLGFTFSFGWTPCIGPVLGAILGVSASGQDPLYGILLISIYALGLVLPFVVISLFSEVLLKRIRNLHKYMGQIKIVGGMVIILMGILLMFNQLSVLIALAT